MQKIQPIKRIPGSTFLVLERPTVLAHVRMNDRHRDHVFELLQRAEDQRAMSPWAGQRNVKMVTTWFSLEASLASLGRLAIRRYPVAPLRLRAHETPAACLCVVPLVVPLAVNKKSHGSSSRFA